MFIYGKGWSLNKALHLQCKISQSLINRRYDNKSAHTCIIEKCSRSAKYIHFNSILAHSLSEMAQIRVVCPFSYPFSRPFSPLLPGFSPLFQLEVQKG
jgi:hypothetical protein